MASPGVSPLLEAKVKAKVGTSEGVGRDHRVDQGDGKQQSTLGSGADPWRITQAGYSRVPAAQSKSTCGVCARLDQRGQNWRTFLRNHTGEIWACDFLQVTDLLFRSLFAFFIIELKSRKVIHVGVTRAPTDAWTARTWASYLGYPFQKGRS